VVGMTGGDEHQVRRAIRACRSAGLPVTEPGDCTCGLSGHLVVLARPDGLRVQWPAEQRCPIHAPPGPEAPIPPVGATRSPLADRQTDLDPREPGGR
jgi:hypothetical protein